MEKDLAIDVDLTTSAFLDIPPECWLLPTLLRTYIHALKAVSFVTCGGFRPPKANAGTAKLTPDQRVKRSMEIAAEDFGSCGDLPGRQW
jgi:hypothetical protein